MSKLTILIVGRSKSATYRLSQYLAEYPDFFVSTRVISNGHLDPLHGVNTTPDLLLLHYGPGQSELKYLAENGLRDPVPLIVCGPTNDPSAMRLAMRAGARDYLPVNVSEKDFVASVLRIQEEILRGGGTTASGKLVVVMNGKGGSGASFLAANLAHSLVLDAGKRATLFDLDLQFGGLCRYLDLAPQIGILEALEMAREMDEVSAKAFTCEHSSGLRLLAAPSKGLVSPNKIPVEELEALLNVFLSNNDYVVADAPNRLDTVTEFFLERAHRIILVVQQSLPHVQDTARLLHLLTNEIAVPAKRIRVIVNRFTKNALIELGDIKKALRQEKLITIPNQYKLAAESINSGVPVAEISKNAALTKGIRELQAALGGQRSALPQNFLTRALPGILRR